MRKKNVQSPTTPSNWSKLSKAPKGKQQKVKPLNLNCHEKLETEQAEPNQRRTEERRKRRGTTLLFLRMLLRK